MKINNLLNKDSPKLKIDDLINKKDSSNNPSKEENNFQIPDCEPDAPYKMEFAKADIDFVFSSIKVPSIKVPSIKIDDLICCLKDILLYIHSHEILYLCVILIIKIIHLIKYDPI